LNIVQRQDIHNSEVPIVCLACEARHKGVCGSLTPLQLSHLSKHTKRHAVGPGVEIVAAGVESGQYSNILGGVVKLSKLLPDGRQQIVGLQFAPDFIGRPFRRQNDVSAEAATNVRVCSFPKSVLEEIITKSAQTEHRLHEQALRELDEAREWMITLGRKTAAEKIASFLCLIAQHHDAEKDWRLGSVTFDIPLRRADIADFLGLTLETVSRHITKLRKAGIIAIANNRTITVFDPEKLIAACDSSD
jgi:CRP/FNR family transcriptional regulator, anaerobic regulatory protein